MAEGILVILVLFLLAGGGIIVIDSLIIRKIRVLGPPSDGGERMTDHTISR